ncbi:hypothetical protein FDP41_010339 [Naegleria fowleri]|uniref:Uncharacterized protein n=1 Tax=Naegleria fowleri TaxID=5763 RepID=A0A6A5C9R4_NAEFO|nr:uncharacterized protein FDP41_010339 [Naegleria fowleri]KAF0983274.1 hypothetical protein FDP41_010339 [Naegleria fowleri]CAG4718001.1 unnamed protein product [Naegleria fowleri]
MEPTIYVVKQPPSPPQHQQLKSSRSTTNQQLMQQQQLRMTPSTLVVKKIPAKIRGGVKVSSRKPSEPSENTSSFILENSQNYQTKSIPSLFPATLKPRQTSAPIQSTRSIGESEFGSLTSRKTSTSKITNITSSNQSGEKKSHHNATVDVSLKHSQENLLEKKLECLLNDDDIYSARQSIRDAYLFKSYERDTSKFARKISLSQLGVTLVFETKESFYNFYNRFKTSNSGSTINFSMDETELEELKNPVSESNMSNNLEQQEIQEAQLSTDPFITEEEKLEIVNTMEKVGEPYLVELFKTKYKTRELLHAGQSLR